MHNLRDVSDPLIVRWVIEFQLIYHLQLSKADIDNMDDKDVMRLYHSLVIQKKLEVDEQKKQERKRKSKSKRR